MWWVALFAGVCMVVQDILATLLVQAEARNRRALAGAMDAAQWLFGMATTAISVTAFQGHDTWEKIVVASVVTVANFVGTFVGTHLGEKWISPAPCPLEDRVAALERMAGPHHA